jgi:hypothetical protein
MFPLGVGAINRLLALTFGRLRARGRVGGGGAGLINIWGEYVGLGGIVILMLGSSLGVLL